MEKTIRILNRDILVSLHDATVIHANKYSETSGGWGILPVTSNLYTDIVFRSRANNEDWPVKTNTVDLPIYTDQAVTVISADNIIIGYIDEQTKQYYYTGSNLCNKLGFGIPYYLVWLIGIAGAVIIGLLNPGEWTLLLLVPFIIAWLIYRIQKWILHLRIRQAIDHYLQDE